MEWKNLMEVLTSYAQSLEEAYRGQVLDNSYASGRLFDSVRSIIQVDESYIEVFLNLEDYWKYLEDGRSPGRFPPVDRIREWIRVKPIVPYPDSRGRVPSPDQLAFLIGRSIAENGIEGKHLLENAMDETSDWMTLIDEAIEMDVREEIDEILSLIL